MTPSDSTPTGSAKPGTWPEKCLQRAFVEGAAWWELLRTGATMWATDRGYAEVEAINRYGEPAGAPTPPQEPPTLTTTDGEGQHFWIARDEYEQYAALRSEISRLQEAASERDAIATVLTDRSEAGTYAKVEALVAEVSRLRAQIRAMAKNWRLIPSGLTAWDDGYESGLIHCALELEQLADDQESQG